MKEGRSWLWIVLTSVALNVVLCGVQRGVDDGSRGGAVVRENHEVPDEALLGENFDFRSRRGVSGDSGQGPSSASPETGDGSDKKWPNDGIKPEVGSEDSKKNSSENNNNATGSSKQPSAGTGDGSKSKGVPGPTRGVTLIQSKPPDKGVDVSKLKDKLEPKDSDETGPDDGPETNLGNQTKFDEKAIQRALVVMVGLAGILIVYFGVKFAMLRKKKMDKRYGRIESEMDLLDEIEVESEEEDDTLFDVNTVRRSHL